MSGQLNARKARLAPYVQAGWISCEASFAATGSEAEVTGWTDEDGNTVDESGWITVAGKIRLILQAEPDDQSVTITVEGRVHPNATEYDLVAGTAVTASTPTRLPSSVSTDGEGLNIEGVHSIRVLQNGTPATGNHAAYLLVK